MLSSLRKKPEAALPTVPAWHPSFRNYERLPDTKVVRTSFFINGAAVLAALAVLLFTGYQEFNRATLQAELEEWSATIEAGREANAAALANFKKFQEQEVHIKEAGAFVERKLVPSDLILRIAETLPPNVTIEYIDLRSAGVTLRGSVRGSPGEASGIASRYVGQLQADEQLAPLFESITLTNVARSAVADSLSIEITLKLPVPVVKGARKS